MEEKLEKKLKILNALQLAEIGFSALLVPAGALAEYHLLYGNGALGCIAGFGLKGIADYGMLNFVESREKFLRIRADSESRQSFYSTLIGKGV
jgi:hypothetical protein